jgi:hypothetical protein
MSEAVQNPNCVIAVRGFGTREEQRKTVALRYLTFRKFVSMLELQAVWFSRLGALQDRFEATLPVRVHARLKARDRKYAEQLASDKDLLPRIQTMTERNVDGGRKMFAVNCWFLGEQESQKMWNEYGEEGNGVAVRSTVERLSLSFPKLGGLIQGSVIDRVKYVDFESHDMDEKEAINIDKTAFLKTNDKLDEQEVRILTPNICFNTDGISIKQDQFTQKGLYVECLLQKLIQAVIVGPRAESHFFALIERLVSRYQLCVDVEKSQLPNLAINLKPSNLPT